MIQIVIVRVTVGVMHLLSPDRNLPLRVVRVLIRRKNGGGGGRSRGRDQDAAGGVIVRPQGRSPIQILVLTLIQMIRAAGGRRGVVVSVE